MKNILVNTRCLSTQITGVQRYTKEILAHFNIRDGVLKTISAQQGIQGHIWEQLYLPLEIKNCLLWSPANSGPIAISNQVVTIHDIAVLAHPEWFSAKFSLWYRFILPILAVRAKKIITVSLDSKRQIVKRLNIPASKVIYIYNGVDNKFTPQKQNKIDSCINLLGLPSSKYLLVLGSLEPRKNIQRILDAWSTCLNKVAKDIWLIIVGSKGVKGVFSDIRLTKIPERTHFTGHIEDEFLPAIYSGAIAFLYPSIYEGFGLPLLEAMSCGTPVLTSNLTSMPEISGNAALLVDPYDVRAISDGIKQLAENKTLREQLKLKGIDRAKKFTWELCANQTWKVLQEAAGYIA